MKTHLVGITYHNFNRTKIRRRNKITIRILMRLSDESQSSQKVLAKLYEN